MRTSSQLDLDFRRLYELFLLQKTPQEKVAQEKVIEPVWLPH
jgi:hypothetical protein